MTEACNLYRTAWLAGEATIRHDESCVECAAWRRRTEHVTRVLRALPRRAVPDELAFRVEDELAGRHERRIERILSSLTPLRAPDELDERVGLMLGIGDDALGDDARGERSAGLLGTLDVQPAPNVLERLIEEELSDPAAHRAARFPGDLERLQAPPALELRVERTVRRRAWRRLIAAPAASLAAAGVLVWFLVQRSEEPRRAYSFQVEHAASLEGLDPMTRQLAAVLGGGPAVSGALPAGRPR